MSGPNSRLVFSTSIGRMCPHCGSPKESCRCKKASDASDTLPRRVTAKLRMERAGRGGKMVTVVDGLPKNPAFLATLSQELKRTCGTGGVVLESGVQLQGDVRDRVRAVLIDKGFQVKG